MKYFHFNENVYLVDGYCLSTIYDINFSDLYSINKLTRDFIVQVISKGTLLNTLSQDESIILQKFIDYKILLSAEYPGTIEDIRKLKLNFPAKFAWIEVTRRCNMACTFCYEKSNPTCHEYMKFEDFETAIENLKEISVKRIQFIGGEPLLLKGQLKKMVLACREDFDFIEIYTNGILIDEDWCKFFQANNIHIATSIHSYLPEEHDRIVSMQGAHKKVTKAVQMLKCFNIKYRIAAISSKSCILGEPQKDTFYHIIPVDQKVTGRADLGQYTFDMFRKKAITKKTQSKAFDKGKLSKLVTGHQCFLKNIYIASNLTVYPCVMERRHNYGNLHTKRLSNMLNDDLRFLSKDKIDVCKDCEYRYSCSDCRPDSNGKGIHEKPWYCTYDPYSGTWINLEKKWNSLLKESRIL